MQWSPPQPPDKSPLIALRESLARQREAGEDFNSAWVRCSTDVLRTIPDHQDRSSWRTALERTREGWRRGYARTPLEKIDGQLSLVAADRGVATSGRTCDWCHGDLPSTATARARFCSREHSKAHSATARLAA